MKLQPKFPITPAQLRSSPVFIAQSAEKDTCCTQSGCENRVMTRDSTKCIKHSRCECGKSFGLKEVQPGLMMCAKCYDNLEIYRGLFNYYIESQFGKDGREICLWALSYLDDVEPSDHTIKTYKYAGKKIMAQSREQALLKIASTVSYDDEERYIYTIVEYHIFSEDGISPVVYDKRIGTDLEIATSVVEWFIRERLV